MVKVCPLCEINKVLFYSIRALSSQRMNLESACLFGARTQTEMWKKRARIGAAVRAADPGWAGMERE